MISLILYRFPFTLLFLFRCCFRFRFLFPFPFLFLIPVSGFSRRPMKRSSRKILAILEKIENSRQYLLLRTDVFIMKIVVGCQWMLNNCLVSTPRSDLLPFLTENGTPLAYLLLTNGTSFTHYLSLELCVSFYYCKCTLGLLWDLKSP